jgi:hypothetical protein
MAISTFAELQDQIAAFLNRQDLADKIPTFIALAEADINRRVRHYNMMKRQNTTLSANTDRITQPADWVEAINIQATRSSGDYRLKYVSPADLDDLRDRDERGAPLYYSLIGSEIEVAPKPESNVSIEQIYYGKIPALSDGATSNWLLTSHPDAYLYGALLHSAPYLDEDARLQTWGAGYERAVAGVNDSSRRSMLSGGPLARRGQSFG